MAAFFNGISWSDTTTTPALTKASASAAKINVDELLNLQGDQTKYTSDATAAGYNAAGYNAETDMYNNAADAATSEAALAKAGGDILAYQDQRKLDKTIGSQKADVAGAGFKNAGSALYLAKSSYQQGYLTKQLDNVNSSSKEAGYLETAAANRSEATATSTASAAATSLQQTDNAAAQTSKTNADNLGTSLTDYYQTVDPNSVTPEDQLTMSLLKSNPDQALSNTVNNLNTTATANKTTWDSAASINAGQGPLPATGTGAGGSFMGRGGMTEPLVI